MKIYSKLISKSIFILFLLSPLNVDSLGKEEITNPEISTKLTLPNYQDEYYIIGFGDSLAINFEGISKFSNEYKVSLDGTIILPRIGKFKVEGLTLEELKNLLMRKYEVFLRNPSIEVSLVQLKPISFLINGEINLPGYYSLPVIDKGITLSDVLKTGRGITPFSKLDEIHIRRKLSKSDGGGYKLAKVNLLSLITEGDLTGNIKIMHDDVIFIPKTNIPIKSQILKQVASSNLNPETIAVFVQGSVRRPGTTSLPQGSTLNQAIAVAGGPKIFKGKVEFLRFSKDSSIDRRVFNYSPNDVSNTEKNPILMSGDIVKIRTTLVGSTAEVLDEISRPVVGFVGLGKIFGFID